jgi:hypothetical protein
MYENLCGNQWRLVGFIVEEANLNKHSNNNNIYTIIIIFLNTLYRVPQNAYQYVVKLEYQVKIFNLLFYRRYEPIYCRE